MRVLSIGDSRRDELEPRVGGVALLGSIENWSTTTSGEPLHLIASFPARFLGIERGRDEFVSVFSFYSKRHYFLDRVTYHGDPSEMRVIEGEGTTRVVFHDRQCEVFEANTIPTRRLIAGELAERAFQGSGLGGFPGFLQNESIAIDSRFEFALQLYGGDFPEGWSDIFGLSDAVGYLFVDKLAGEGLFFVQAT
ncbi:hypothetical protein CUJ89_02205 [Burkholderia pyrrocinia]|uniref:DUF1963 domain-containing protein n=2 Tax=Burkholderia pyrrocinia TaxID=60550 RepID=A0A2Z5MQI3_BURPY|nr:hypothetical protein CUJ89_02205 [Burkholderia pyrrocinia]